MPAIARLIEEVHSGTVGQLRMLAIREHRFPFLEKVGNWNRFSRYSGGTLVEKCCHFFDLMRLIIGCEPMRLYASGAQDVNHLDERIDGETPDILDNAYVVIDFENGVRAMLDLCMFAEASRDQEEIAATGDCGKVECGIPSSTLIIGKRQPVERMGVALPLERATVSVDPDLLEIGHHNGATHFQHERFLRMLQEGGGPRSRSRTVYVRSPWELLPNVRSRKACLLPSARIFCDLKGSRPNVRLRTFGLEMEKLVSYCFLSALRQSSVSSSEKRPLLRNCGI